MIHTKKIQRIRDPLHNLIEFNCCNDDFENELWKIIQAPSFQRLRRIKQLGFSDFVYPGATHTRFSHSLGTFYIARQLLQLVEKKHTSIYNPAQAQHALAAALLHDVGHGPFSHAFEEFGKKYNLDLAKHENVSSIIIRKHDVGRLLDKLFYPKFSEQVADIIQSSPSKYYGAIVSSQFDADRLDYMQRDRLMTGTRLGNIDFTWLLANIELGEVPWGTEDEEPKGPYQTFVLGEKAVHAAESYVLGLFQLYPTVYFHKTTRCLEKIYTLLLGKLYELI